MKIIYSNIRIGTKSNNLPVLLRNLNLSMQRVIGTPVEKLSFKTENIAEKVLGTDYFNRVGIIKENNTINPIDLLVHLENLKKQKLLSLPIAHGLKIRQEFKNISNTKTLEEEIFSAVMGRYLNHESNIFLPKYGELTDKVSLAVMYLIQNNDRTHWDKNKPVLDEKGLRIDLSGIQFPKFRSDILSEIDFNNVILQNADFNYSILRRGSFINSFLVGADLSATDCSKANFCGANLRSADLFFTDFTMAILEKCNFRQAILKNTIFTSANMKGAILLEPKVCKDIKVDNADLENAKIQSYIRFKVDLSKAKNTNKIIWISK